MEDRRAHERIDNLEATLKKLADAQERTDAALTENTALTRQLVQNTQTLVDLVRGAKAFRGAILWMTPVVAAVYVVVSWIRSH